MNDTTISILMPVYNRQRYVAEAINSILKQTYTNIQLLVYDDGSTDRTVEVVRSYKDPRIKLEISNINRGVAYARNVLLDWCDTKYAAWQDSDDASNIYRIEMQYNLIKNSNSFVFTGFAPLVNGYNIAENPKCNQTSCANASILFIVDKDILFDNQLKIGEDEKWKQKLSKKYNEIKLPKTLYYVRYHNCRNTVLYRVKK